MSLTKSFLAAEEIFYQTGANIAKRFQLKKQTIKTERIEFIFSSKHFFDEDSPIYSFLHPSTLFPPPPPPWSTHTQALK